MPDTQLQLHSTQLQASPAMGRPPVQDRINIRTGSPVVNGSPAAFRGDEMLTATHVQARIASRPYIPSSCSLHVPESPPTKVRIPRATSPGSRHIQERVPLRPGTLIRTVAVRRDHAPSHYAMLGVGPDLCAAPPTKSNQAVRLLV